MPYLIDGHNLIGRTPGLRLDEPDDERKLVGLLRDHLARLKKKGTVIFDRGTPGQTGSWSSHNLEVKFARPPQIADDLILARLRSARNPRGLIVITSDARLAAAARRAGAAVKDAGLFAREMLAPASLPAQKEKGLSAAEVEAWEREFKEKRQAR